MLLHWGFALGWELFHPNIEHFDWNRITAKWFVLMPGLISALSPLAIFALFAGLVSSYYRVIELDLLQLLEHSSAGNSALPSCSDKMLTTMQNVQLLNRFTRLLHSRLDTLIVPVVSWSFMSLIVSSYYLVEYAFFFQNVLAITWDAFQLLEFYSRFVVICHSIDSMRSSVL